ncbi:hypothetical protein Q5741_08250 [Paenibacillus sp. JX-17]|uniref:DUF697 domain-containing protein n=1 Tax=Paenibacillus lacisoli TaxID=3064525 RepID=A0ABT9CAX9_9BACL|nr:hypothetical protein [Paenibacillus sp. JX-17]MDO7906407.1 hypothetical protein [Paenibacillus sp. JX-17]
MEQMPRTIEELEAIRNQCRAMVNKRAFASGGTSLVPLPGTDIVADVSILMELLPNINSRFGLSDKQLEGLDPETKAMVYGFITSIGSKMIGRLVTREAVLQLLRKIGIRIATKQAAKFMPILGQGVAAVLGYSAMRTIGYKHIEQCYSVAKQLLEQRSRLSGSAGPAADAGLPVPEQPTQAYMPKGDTPVAALPEGQHGRHHR